MASFVGFVFHTLPRVGRRILQSLNGPEVDEETDSGNAVVPVCSSSLALGLANHDIHHQPVSLESMC